MEGYCTSLAEFVQQVLAQLPLMPRLALLMGITEYKLQQSLPSIEQIERELQGEDE